MKWSERVYRLLVDLPSVRYDAPQRVAFHDELTRRLQQIPGVAAAGAIDRLPATGTYHPWTTSILSGPKAGTKIATGDGYKIQQRTINGNIFSALQIPVLAGRTFDERDDEHATRRAVVSANFARAAFPGLPLDGAVGQLISAAGQKLQVIGVVGDVALDAYGAPTLVVYQAHNQDADNRNWALSYVVATKLPPEQMLGAVRAAVASIDPELVVYNAAPLTDVVSQRTSRERFALVLMGSFAGLSLLLATLGLYGVLAYAVGQRTREIGIRIALGATPSQIRSAVFRSAAIVLGIGAVAGAAGALALERWLSALAFGISPSDPRILLAAIVLLAITGLGAAWLPARRASRVAPRAAMQEDG